MVRPRSLILQRAGTEGLSLPRIGRMLQAVISLAHGLAAGRVDWSLSKVLVVPLYAGGRTALFPVFS